MVCGTSSASFVHSVNLPLRCWRYFVWLAISLAAVYLVCLLPSVVSIHM